MKYEEYKQLSPNLKEEYNFKYKQKPGLMLQGLYNTITIFALTFIILALLYSMALKDDKMASVLPALEIIFTNLAKAMRILLFSFIIYAVFILFDFIIFYVGEYLWVRKHRVK